MILFGNSSWSIPNGEGKTKIFILSRVPLSRARELVKEYGIDGYPGITKLLGDDPMDGKEDDDDVEEEEQEKEEKKKNAQKEVNHDHVKKPSSKGKLSLLTHPKYIWRAHSFL